MSNRHAHPRLIQRVNNFLNIAAKKGVIPRHTYNSYASAVDYFYIAGPTRLVMVSVRNFERGFTSFLDDVCEGYWGWEFWSRYKSALREYRHHANISP